MRTVLFLGLIFLTLSFVPLNPKSPTQINEGIYHIGVNDHQTDLFEGQYPIPNGISYNSYLIVDSSIAVIDTVDERFRGEWFQNIEKVLKDRLPDYLIINHMEPDHAGSIDHFMQKYPKTKIVSSVKAFNMMINFFGTDYPERKIVVKEGSTLEVGKHQLTFVEAPLVHWPEVIVSYDSLTKTLFSADGFGKFGANDIEENWDDEARRYFIGIVGKFGQQVQDLLKKAATLEIKMICPSHGPMINSDLGKYINLYDIWSSYSVETDGILICYTSVYGHTKQGVEIFAEKLRSKGAPLVKIIDLARTDVSYAVADAFRYSKLVLATTTYNSEIFPFMRNFIQHLIERFFQNRHIAFIENGSWAPYGTKTMKEMLKNSKYADKLYFAKNEVLIKGSVNEETEKMMEKLADEICSEYLSQKGLGEKMDLSALNNIQYGLYVVTSYDGKKHNGAIVNTVMQITNKPNRIAVGINKNNYSHDVIKKSGIMNLNILNAETPFSIFKHFGFQTGRKVDKFKDFDAATSENGLKFLKQYINSFMSLKVANYIDVGSHGLFICDITEARTFTRIETLTYAAYHACVKPRPNADRNGYVCKVCGYIYEGETLPDDYICPLCKHCSQDFQKLVKK